MHEHNRSFLLHSFPNVTHRKSRLTKLKHYGARQNARMSIRSHIHARLHEHTRELTRTPPRARETLAWVVSPEDSAKEGSLLAHALHGALAHVRVELLVAEELLRRQRGYTHTHTHSHTHTRTRALSAPVFLS
eukprot:370341-Pleurochrysis_carterae.AAC.2